MELFFSALLSGLLTGLVAAGVTLAIERLGGQVGGVIGSSPTTVVVVSLSFATRMSGFDLRAAMFAVAPAMLNNAAFLGTWLFLPRKLPVAWSKGRKVAALVGASLIVWFLGACTIVLLNRNKEERSIDNVVLSGYVCMALQAAIGLAACFTPLPAPKGANKVGLATLAARGAAAAAAVFVSVLVSAVDDFAAGVASCFPAIFMTSMVSLWIAQGSGVPSGAIGPLILGSVSVPFYAIVFSLMVTRPGEHDGSDPAPATEGWSDDRHAVYPPLAALVTWALSVVCVCIPVALFLRWRRQQSPPAASASADSSAPAPGAVKLDDADGSATHTSAPAASVVPDGVVAIDGSGMGHQALHKQDSTDAIVGVVGAGSFSAAAAHAGHPGHHDHHDRRDAYAAASFSSAAARLNSTQFHSVPLVAAGTNNGQHQFQHQQVAKAGKQAPVQAVPPSALAQGNLAVAGASAAAGAVSAEWEPSGSFGLGGDEVDAASGEAWASGAPEVIAVVGFTPVPPSVPSEVASVSPQVAAPPVPFVSESRGHFDASVSQADPWGTVPSGVAAAAADSIAGTTASPAVADPWASPSRADPWGTTEATPSR